MLINPKKSEPVTVLRYVDDGDDMTITLKRANGEEQDWPADYLHIYWTQGQPLLSEEDVVVEGNEEWEMQDRLSNCFDEALLHDYSRLDNLIDKPFNMQLPAEVQPPEKSFRAIR